MSEAADIQLIREPSKQAKLAFGLSIGALIAVVLACVGFGFKVGGRDEAFTNVRARIEILEVKKADKEVIETKLESLQRTCDEIKSELRRRRWESNTNP